MAHSEYSLDDLKDLVHETESVWSFGLHWRISSDAPASGYRSLTAFITVQGLYQWTRVAMGLKGAGPYFQRSMSSIVQAGLVYRICELYIDDVLIHGSFEREFLANVRLVFTRLCEYNITVILRKPG